MPDALASVKRELGPDAVILGTRTLPSRGLGTLLDRDRVEITAASSDAAARPPRLATRSGPVSAGETMPVAAASNGVEDLPASLQDSYVRLVQSEVAGSIAAQIVRDASRAVVGPEPAPTAVRDALRERIARMIPACNGLEWSGTGQHRVAFVGTAGAGKTTTLAKLAARYKLVARKQVALLTLDVHRMGACAQLARYAEIIGVPVRSAASVPQVQQALRDSAQADLLLVDSPGIGLGDAQKLRYLRELLGAAVANEVHLVLPSSAALAVQSRTAAVFSPFGVTHIVLTKLDDAVGWGVILSVVQQLNLKLSYVTNGQNVPKDLIPACSKRVAELIFA